MFQNAANSKGRPELASAPAQVLLCGSPPAVWHRPGIGLHHLSHVLRCAISATDAEILRFLDKIATPDWIDDQISTQASTGGLAGSLHALSNILRPDLREHFLRPCLPDRVTTELTINPSSDSSAWANSISLLGTTASLGLQVDSVAAHWPGVTDLAAILALRAPDPAWTTIGPLQIQLWLGLREMVRMRDDVVSVPPEYGELVLTLWRATHDGEKGPSALPHARETNARMIAWFDNCRVNGWRLTK